MANEFKIKNGLIVDLGGAQITGSLRVTGGITGSLQGTSSWATNTTSASFASTASYTQTAQTASYVLNAISSSFATTASYFAGTVATASYALTALTASSVTGLGSFNYTASYTAATTWTVNHSLGTKTVLIQAYDSTDNQIIPKSIVLNNTNTATITFNTPESGYAVATVGGALNFATASVANLATTASYILNAVSSSYAATASLAPNYVLNSVTSSMTVATASVATVAISASLIQITNTTSTAGNYYPIFVAGTTTGIYLAPRVDSSRFIYNTVTDTLTVTSSYAIEAVTASYVNTLNQSVVVTGSLTVGATSAGIGENSITLGPAPNGGAGEGGQLGLNAAGGSYTSASFIDVYQDRLRILKGTNAGSNTELASINSQTGYLTLAYGAVTMTSRPAFRVVGATTGAGADKATPTILSGSLVTIDYNQGSYYNNTNGQFTCPVAGLYHVWYVGRTQNASLAAVSILKNNTTVLAYWESNTNTGHFGTSAVVSLAANDVVTTKVTAGTITFDTNDNWGVAYIG